jgi:hypothetical protein
MFSWPAGKDIDITFGTPSVSNGVLDTSHALQAIHDLLRNSGRLRDNQASIGGALRVVLEHEFSGHISRLFRQCAGKWRHDQTMLHLDRSDLNRRAPL